jgi:hypothetical protein
LSASIVTSTSRDPPVGDVGEQRLHGLGQPLVDLMRHQLDRQPRVALAVQLAGEVAHHRGGVVGRAVVHHDYGDVALRQRFLRQPTDFLQKEG